mmetsp:Transcript_142317/g.396577  ORF Transcript_142317/g.396577 Transcript_142317/m.396577 type:complete len:375 (-) Transcript_142317:537-1661(-)
MACLAFTWTRRASSGEITRSRMYLLSFVNCNAFLLVRNERRVKLEVMLDTNHDARRKPAKSEAMAKHRSGMVSGNNSMLPARFVSDQWSAMMYCSQRWSSSTPIRATQLPLLERPMPSHMHAAPCAVARIAPVLVAMLMSRATLSERAFSAAVSRSFSRRSSRTRRIIRRRPMTWAAVLAVSVKASIQSTSTSTASGSSHVLAYFLAMALGRISKLPSGRLMPVRKDTPMSHVQRSLVTQVIKLETGFSGTSRNSSGATTASWMMHNTVMMSQMSLFMEVGRRTRGLHRGASRSSSWAAFKRRIWLGLRLPTVFTMSGTTWSQSGSTSKERTATSESTPETDDFAEPKLVCFCSNARGGAVSRQGVAVSFGRLE